jgi:hypothetical protein
MPIVPSGTRSKKRIARRPFTSITSAFASSRAPVERARHARHHVAAEVAQHREEGIGGREFRRGGEAEDEELVAGRVDRTHHLRGAPERFARADRAERVEEPRRFVPEVLREHRVEAAMVGDQAEGAVGGAVGQLVVVEVAEFRLDLPPLVEHPAGGVGEVGLRRDAPLDAVDRRVDAEREGDGEQVVEVGAAGMGDDAGHGGPS